MPFRRFAFLLVVTLLTTPGGVVVAQDVAAEVAKSEASSGEATARYNALFEEWKSLLKDLRKLKSEYTSAKPDETKALVEQWKTLLAKGNELLPQLRAAGKDAYAEGATVDPQLQRFLLKLAQDALDTDDYEVGYELATAMLDRSEQDKAPPPKELYNIAAICGFMTSHYDTAERYFVLAKESGTLTDRGTQLQGDLKLYKEWWEKELAIRAAEAEKDDLPRVKISTTAGDIVVELFENEAPETVGNFVSLAEAKFYDGLAFHRVLPGFMAQGGDPKGDGTGGPGYHIYCETDNPNYRRHFRGSLSMAKSAAKDTGGSQFFICFTPQKGLDGVHTVFGRVIEGLDVLARIQRVDPEDPKPVEKTKMESVEVLRKRDHKYLPRKVE